MSYANDITGLLEDRAQAYLRSVAPSRIPYGQIYTGIDDETLALPRVVCQCTGADRILEADGKWDAELKLIIRTSCDDTPRQRHRDVCGEIFSYFGIERLALADALSGFGGFTADDILMKAQGYDLIAGADKKRTWVSWMTFSVKCRGSIFQAEAPLPVDLLPMAPLIYFDAQSSNDTLTNAALWTWHDRISTSPDFHRGSSDFGTYPPSKRSDGLFTYLEFIHSTAPSNGTILALAGQAFVDIPFSFVCVLKNPGIFGGLIFGAYGWQVRLASETGLLDLRLVIGNREYTVFLGDIGTSKTILAVRFTAAGILVRINGVTYMSSWISPNLLVTASGNSLTVGGLQTADEGTLLDSSTINVYVLAGWESELTSEDFREAELILSRSENVTVNPQSAKIFVSDVTTNWLPTWAEGSPAGFRSLTIENISNEQLQWVAQIVPHDGYPAWVSNPGSGILNPGAKTQITLTLNSAAADILAATATSLDVNIINSINGQGNATLHVIPTIT